MNAQHQSGYLTVSNAEKEETKRKTKSVEKFPVQYLPRCLKIFLPCGDVIYNHLDGNFPKLGAISGCILPFWSSPSSLMAQAQVSKGSVTFFLSFCSQTRMIQRKEQTARIVCRINVRANCSGLLHGFVGKSKGHGKVP